MWRGKKGLCGKFSREDLEKGGIPGIVNILRISELQSLGEGGPGQRKFVLPWTGGRGKKKT